MSIVTELRELEEMHRAGSLSDEAYTAVKAKVIGTPAAGYPGDAAALASLVTGAPKCSLSCEWQQYRQQRSGVLFESLRPA